jgi:hypothetical protein
MLVDENPNDLGELISSNGVATEPTGTEDRGDVVATKLGEELPVKEVARAEPKKEADEELEDHKPVTIPKARFDEVNTKRKDAEAQLEAANRELELLRQPKKEAAPAAQPVDLDDKEQAYMDAMFEGDAAKAKEIRREINAELIQQAEQRMESKSYQRESANMLMAEAAQTIKDYPYLDTPEGAEALEIIKASRDAKINNGMAHHQALHEAVAMIAPKFAPAAEAGERKPVADTRTEQALRRGAADSNLQPPAVQAGIGNRATPIKPNVERMDEDQFAALSKAEKAALRGD